MPSTVIAQMDYDKGTNVLQIVFVSGTVYDYLDVPETVFSEMRSAKSKGVFLNQRIKPFYAYRKIRKKEMDLARQQKKLFIKKEK